MIIADKVTASRSGRKLIDDISIELKPGQFTVVIRPNGAGKSTLMKV